MVRNLGFAILALGFSVSIAAKDARRELTVNLKFVPQEGVQSNSPDLTSSVLERSAEIRLEDARGADMALTIGQGTNDDDQSFPVRASTDLIPYISDTLKQIGTTWGLKRSDAPERILTLRLSRFFVEESNKALGSVYAAEVKFTFVLADANGKQLMEGASSGSAHRYGRSRSADNCNEVLSDSLKEAFANVLSDPRLQEAWSSGRSTSGKGSQAATGETVEERLRKLDDLLKKGLITKEEYEKKRAEILKGI